MGAGVCLGKTAPVLAELYAPTLPLSEASQRVGEVREKAASDYRNVIRIQHLRIRGGKY